MQLNMEHCGFREQRGETDLHHYIPCEVRKRIVMSLGRMTCVL